MGEKTSYFTGRWVGRRSVCALGILVKGWEGGVWLHAAFSYFCFRSDMFRHEDSFSLTRGLNPWDRFHQGGRITEDVRSREGEISSLATGTALAFQVSPQPNRMKHLQEKHPSKDT